MNKYYIATVHIAVLADNDAEACDSISECLTNNLKYNGAIVDWQYTNSNFDNPKAAGELDLLAYEEGEAFINVATL